MPAREGHACLDLAALQSRGSRLCVLAPLGVSSAGDPTDRAQSRWQAWSSWNCAPGKDALPRLTPTRRWLHLEVHSVLAPPAQRWSRLGGCACGTHPPGDHPSRKVPRLQLPLKSKEPGGRCSSVQPGQ